MDLSTPETDVFGGDFDEVLGAVYARSARLRARRRTLVVGATGFAVGVAVTLAVLVGVIDLRPGSPGVRLVEPAGSPAHATTVPGPSGRQIWRSAALGAVGSLPAYGEGRLYVAAADRTVYALDAATGQTVWSHTLCCTPTSPAIPPTVDYAAGRVIVASPDTPVQALDARTGQPAWTTDGTAPWLTDGGVAVVGPLVVSAGPAGIRAFRVSTGDPVWTVPHVAAGLAAPNASSVFVVVGERGGAGDRLWELDLRTGRLRWSANLGATVHSRFTATQDTVYVIDDVGDLHAIATDDGRQRWLAHVAPPVCGAAATCPDDIGGFRSQPNITAGLVTLGDDAGVIRAIDTGGGVLRWQVPTGAPVRSSPMVSLGVVYAGNDSSSLFAIDLATGERRWTAVTPGPVRSMPTVVNGFVYVTDATGHVTAFAA